MNNNNNMNFDMSIIEYVDQLIIKAIQQQVSDIHIEPGKDKYRVRYRRDGFLFHHTSLPHPQAARVNARLKVMADLNISERRMPQDGRIQLANFPHVDIRLNTCPTLHGEKMVLRLLDIKKIKLDVHALGMTQEQKQLFLKNISNPQGLILVTGPTGSGKTITLYSALHYLNHIEKNICSVEDPVEIELNGINQVNIHPKIGLDFASVLRTFLRQDPDIIMIGEIRDVETATIAMQAAQTGHLVLSTLHANNAMQAIQRLRTMGIPPYYLMNSISLIIAQRLIRIKKEDNYLGRTAIFELIPMTETIAELILKEAPISQIEEKLIEDNWLSLREIGKLKISEGVTDQQEMWRVIGKV